MSERLAKKVRIRLLEPEDSLAHLTGLLHRAYRQHAERGINALAAFQPEEVTRRRVSVGECYVAAYLGTIVGTIMYKSPRQTAEAWPGVPVFDPAVALEGEGADWAGGGGAASFSQLAVEPEHQGKGIGLELIARCERRAAETAAGRLALSTPEPAEWLVRMYERHGYRTLARHHWPSANYTSAIMAKRVEVVSGE